MVWFLKKPSDFFFCFDLHEVVSCDCQVNMTKTKKRQSAPDREKEIVIRV